MKTKRIVISAMFAALTCVATMIIQIPLTLSGYINLGDCFVLLSGWALGPIYGALAAGIGSAAADIFSGYAIFALPTFIIKSAMAVTAYFIVGRSNARASALPRRILGGITAEIIMIAGYFLTECFLLSQGTAALAGIPMNAIQGVAGVAGGCVLFLALNRIRFFDDITFLKP